MNISIVIPTFNREKLLHSLLSSLYNARQAYRYGKTEVLVVDSSAGEKKKKIAESCRQFDARYIEGDDSVRKKRNKGIDLARYEVIHFIDSDVRVESNILNAHAETLMNSGDPKVAGSFGYTEFVGKKSFWWRVAEHTTYLDSFRFSKMFPYQSWTIGNNVAFFRDVLLKCGKFREDFPYNLGGDDLEFTYRITKSGYLIKSTPEARCFHSTETWNKHAAIQNRTKRWGTMEYYIKSLHPELFVNCIVKSDVRFAFMLVILLLACLATLSPVPLLVWALWVALYILMAYIREGVKNHGLKNPLYDFLGNWFRKKYHAYFILESLRHKDLSCLYQEMTFSQGQTLFMFREASQKLWLWLGAGALALTVTAVISLFV